MGTGSVLVVCFWLIALLVETVRKYRPIDSPFYYEVHDVLGDRRLKVSPSLEGPSVLGLPTAATCLCRG